jgi:hypothetical protein
MDSSLKKNGQATRKKAYQINDKEKEKSIESEEFIDINLEDNMNLNFKNSNNSTKI